MLNKTHYRLFAIAVLLGAPLLVSIVNSAMPGPRIETSQAPRPEYLQPPADPMANLPKPQLPPLPQNQQGAGTAFTAAPTLDPNGLAVSGSDPSPGAGAPADAAAPAVTLPSDAGGGGPSEDELIAQRGG